MSELIKKYIKTMALIWLAFGLVNATGIFPFNKSAGGMEWSKVSQQYNEVGKRFENASGFGDYLLLGIFVLVTALKTIMFLAGSVIFGFQGVLEAFFIPPEIAAMISMVVNAFILLGIGYLMLKRG